MEKDAGTDSDYCPFSRLVCSLVDWLCPTAYPLVLEGNRNPRVRCMDRRIGICVVQRIKEIRSGEENDLSKY